MEYAGKFLKLVEIKTTHQIIKDVVSENKLLESLVQVQRVDCIEEMERAKQLKYYPPPRDSGPEGAVIQAIKNLSQATATKIPCLC
jgi:hypothetical protein